MEQIEDDSKKPQRNHFWSSKFKTNQKIVKRF